MASQVFMTGFPGLIAKSLVDRLLSKDADARFTFLVESRMQGVASSTIKWLETRHPGLGSRTKLVAGDISRPLLGLARETYEAEAAATTHVWHLAAIYDLSVPQSKAYRVNVCGTANVLDFCQAAANLKRFDYVSTCYVAGDRTGLVLESELDEGQGFKNHYESTKCWAELEVRRRMDQLPITIHRPAIVVGDSRTGETDKYDGPYFLINLLLKVPEWLRWLPLVHIGAGEATVNLIPIDFLIGAMATIWTKEESLGLTVHLADPYPHTTREIMETMYEAAGFRKPMATVPSALVEHALAIEPVRKLLRIPQEAVIYFNHDALFDTSNQRRLLAGTNTSCPDIIEVLPVLVDYVRRYPDKPFLDGRAF